jgi:protein-disulfide isomerase
MYRTIAAFSILFALPAFSQNEADYKALKGQVDALKTDVDSLKKQQDAIIQQLMQMQRTLSQQKAASIIDLKGAPERGSKDAKVAVVEFTDFWCGFCARFAQLHDKLFQNYGKYSDSEMAEYVQQAGADPTIFQKCAESDRYAKLVRDSMEQGSAAGVDGTPTFMLGVIDPADPTKLKAVRTVVGAQSLDQFRAAIDAVIESSK